VVAHPAVFNKLAISAFSPTLSTSLAKVPLISSVTLSAASTGPATAIKSLPSSATGVAPKQGAVDKSVEWSFDDDTQRSGLSGICTPAMNAAPAFCKSAATALLVSGCTVVVSTMIFPLNCVAPRIRPIIPWSAVSSLVYYSISACAHPIGIVMSGQAWVWAEPQNQQKLTEMKMIPLSATSCDSDWDAIAPRAMTGSMREAVRLKTTRGGEMLAARSRCMFFAIAAPMLPRPTLESAPVNACMKM